MRKEKVAEMKSQKIKKTMRTGDVKSNRPHCNLQGFTYFLDY